MLVRNHSTLGTLSGFGAILLWACLALLTTLTGSVPPFALCAIAFAIAALGGSIRLVLVPHARAAIRQPLSVWAVGLGGLFGFHALYFAGLRLAPAAQAGLISNLWPLFLVIGADYLGRGRPAVGTVTGGLCAFAGVGLLGTAGIVADAAAWDRVPGYACALGSALIWAWYSLASSRMQGVPTDCVTGFCFLTAILSGIIHGIAEPPLRLDGVTTVLALIALGAGPVGAAFFLWDFGMKHGNARVIGFAAFSTPVLSTGLLVVSGVAEGSWALALACLLVSAGAAVARMVQSP
jgi:drug/metabolite transporter (DMT)-like permease